MIEERPYYNAAVKALQEAHDACFKRHEDVLGMSHGPFSGVNVALGIIDQLERENQMLRLMLSKIKDA